MSDFNKFYLEDGFHIRYKKSGSGKPLLLLHTIRNRLEYFDRVVPLLADSFTVYTLDLPGFGDSPVNKNVQYNQRYMANAIADFIVRNKLSKLTLAGESIGGVLCATIAATLPKRVNQIFVFNPYDYDTFFGEGVRRANLFARFIIWSMSLPAVGKVFTALENRLILWLIFRGGVYNKKAITYSYISLVSTSIRKLSNIYHTRSVFSNFSSWSEAKKYYGNSQLQSLLFMATTIGRLQKRDLKVETC